MKVLVSGASGLVGSALVGHLRELKHDVRALTRNKGEDIFWNPDTGAVDEGALDRWGGPEAFVHLAGESIGNHRWSEEKKRRIRESRVAATEKLCRDLKVPVFVGASAVGYYGNRGDEILTETSSAGSDFLANVCVDWEKAGHRCGDRAVHLRFGMILSPEGGALERMLPIFRWGLGGRLGAGDQWLSWIALEDVIRIIGRALTNGEMAGAYNAVAPNPVTNREFTRELGRALRRPAILPVPVFALRLVFGEMADALLLTSQRVIPECLRLVGFQFNLPEIQSALVAMVGAKK